ncbi:putative holin-like toxin [Staphylococcus rostri]|nr:putative holin-like toxin [Staphylococcus rostri]MDO5376402.1 putative holin-like toxin [Staphylococcus rostri]
MLFTLKIVLTRLQLPVEDALILMIAFSTFVVTLLGLVTAIIKLAIK